MVRFSSHALTLLAAVACGSIAASANVQAQTFPTKIVRSVVPFAPGASTDLVARLFGQKLSEAWGQQVVVENRGGAGGGLGADMVAKAATRSWSPIRAASSMSCCAGMWATRSRT
jgi:tripartite-type tricarboxylate transporter receptor subunit TctC